ncbi:MAG TPA: hypothetical protein VMV33_07960 [Rhodocyclaceae bacterium]|nr:hypothetical protein [Rhodocyclaceae bacterium]
MAGSWSCPHEVDDHCTRVRNLRCDPGMKGCVLAGRYRFFDGGVKDGEKNERLLKKRLAEAGGIPVEVEVAGED